MRVDKGEFAKSFLNYRAPVKREQELHESLQARVPIKIVSPKTWENLS